MLIESMNQSENWSVSQ